MFDARIAGWLPLALPEVISSPNCTGALRLFCHECSLQFVRRLCRDWRGTGSAICCPAWMVGGTAEPIACRRRVGRTGKWRLSVRRPQKRGRESGKPPRARRDARSLGGARQCRVARLAASRLAERFGDQAISDCGCRIGQGNNWDRKLERAFGSRRSGAGFRPIRACLQGCGSMRRRRRRLPAGDS